MSRRKYVVLAAAAVIGVLAIVHLAGSSGGSTTSHLSKFARGGTERQAGGAQATAGEGPMNGWEAYLSASRTYPADVISPAIANKASVAFSALATRDAKKGDPKADGRKWFFYGPKRSATQPGVTSFSGATNETASRITTLVVSPDCSAVKKVCHVWAGASGGGIWRTDYALAGDPQWNQVGPDSLDQNSVGTLVLDPTDHSNHTLLLGTGEGNRCSSGCEAGVGLYRSTDSGNTWTKLADSCVSNATYTCNNPGVDAFLGRGINKIVIDPRDHNHIFVGSAQAVRGLSHVIGNGGTTRLEPGANAPGLYESTDGGATFTEVWNGNSAASFGITDVGIDPNNPDVVYAAAFDQGVWRRDAGAGTTAFSQVFAPQFPGGGTDRTMFALTSTGDSTRMYLTDGTANGGGTAGALASNFWRTDNAGQSAATLLASQAAGATPPDPTTHLFPATYSGWQNLTSKSTASPYFATDDFCTGQCWYDEDVYTPAGHPDTVYVIGSMEYGEQPCSTKGVGCGNGRSNGRTVLYSTTAGDPDGAATGNANMRTFTDLTYDAQDTTAPWCAYSPYFDQGCLDAPNGIHPDEHAIAINPGNPTQIFEGSDGGIIRTSGTFSDTSAQCDDPFRNGGGPLPPTSGSYRSCQRLLSRVPTTLQHIDKKLSGTLQFINVAINPTNPCQVMGGTQDNGTWSNADNCDKDTFNQVIYGDGGNAGYDATNGNWRFNEFTGGFSDSNFENGDPTKWVISSAPLVNSGETFAFYWPQISDPNPAPGTHPIYSGGQHVWRTWAFGAGTAGNVPQDTTPDIAGYEANCPEFVTSGAQAGCGDYRPLGGAMCGAGNGGPSCANTAGDLTGTVYGADRAGGSISFMARDGADHGTLWVATSAGRIFVTHNADASDPADVLWHRIDNSLTGGSPTRFPSGIYADPADTSHAWISYSGYNTATPTTLGHVFDVHEGGPADGSGTFTNLNVESGTSAFPTPNSDGDLPVSDVVRDDKHKALYVSTDFGVLRGDNDGAVWHVTAGMPRYEVMHLEIQPSSRVPTCVGVSPCKSQIYAATHSKGIWQMSLGG
jgi:hypothetical protein